MRHVYRWRRSSVILRVGWMTLGGYAGQLVTWAAGKLKPKLTLQIVRRPDDLHTFQPAAI